MNYVEPDTTSIHVRDANGYFPLAVGNEWIYRIDFEYDLYIHQLSVTGTDIDSSGNSFYVFNTFDTGNNFEFLPKHFRWESGQVWGWFGSYYDNLDYNGTGELNYPLFKFDAEINEYWNVTLLSDVDSLSIYQMSMGLISKTDTIVTEAGTFENCFQFLMSIPYGDFYIFWFAEDVGLVKRSDFHEGSPSEDWILQSTNVSIENKNVILPSKIHLFPAYPNPFNPSTTIRFNIGVGDAKMRPLLLSIYDITGRVVETIVNGAFEPGEHEVVWNASGFASGIYFVRLESGTIVQTQKIVLVK